jgi:hypothetical protein
VEVILTADGSLYSPPSIGSIIGYSALGVLVSPRQAASLVTEVSV